MKNYHHLQLYALPAKVSPGFIVLRSVVFLFFIFISFTCSKEQRPPLEVGFTDPVVGTIGVTSATITATVRANYGDEILERGVCWDTLNTPTVQKNKISEGKGAGTFTVELTGLKGGTRYFVRSYALTSSTVLYGVESNFTTLQLPTLLTLAATNVRGNAAVCNGNLVSDGGLSVKELGFCIDTIPKPDTTKMKRILASPTSGIYSLEVGDLLGGKTYYMVAYARTDAGVAYGNELSFKTPVPATVTTAPLTHITETTVVTGGEVVSDGGSQIRSRGVCWAVSTNPNAGGNNLAEYFPIGDNSGTGSFVSNVKGLIPNTTYYLRAFAQNGAGVGYGEEFMFKTLPAPSALITMITTLTTSAIVEGTVSTNGGTAISERGICWELYATNNLPTVDNNKIPLGSGPGKFSTNITGLKPGTWYAARSYVKTEGGYFYSERLTIATMPGINLVSPADGAIVGCCQINFSWQHQAGYYEFQLSRNANFSGLSSAGSFSCAGGVPAPTGTNYLMLAAKSLCVSMPDSNYNGTWYWRVKVYDVYSPQEWSETRSFVFGY